MILNIYSIIQYILLEIGRQNQTLVIIINFYFIFIIVLHFIITIIFSMKVLSIIQIPLVIKFTFIQKQIQTFNIRNLLFLFIINLNHFIVYSNFSDNRLYLSFNYYFVCFFQGFCYGHYFISNYYFYLKFILYSLPHFIFYLFIKFYFYLLNLFQYYINALFNE